MSVHGLLPQSKQTGYYYITLEETYVVMFKIAASEWFENTAKDDEATKERNARLAHAVAKAYISDVLVNLSDNIYKVTGSEKNIWVFLSFPQLEERLRGACKMRTLKDAMKELIEDGYVFKRPNRDPRYKALEYRLNLEKYRKELQALPQKSDSANLHDENKDIESTENDSAKMHDDSANLHDDDAKMHDTSADSHAIGNIQLTNSKHIEGTYSASTSQQPETSASHDADTLSSLLEKIKQLEEENASLKAQVQAPSQPGETNQASDIAYSQQPPQETVTSVEETGNGSAASVTQPAAEKPAKGRGSRKQSKKQTNVPEQQTMLEETPPEQKKPQAPSADMPWGTTKCKQWFDYWRGAPLIVLSDLKMANSCAKGLSENYTEEQVIEGTKLMKKDSYWSERGVDIGDVARHIHKFVKKIGKTQQTSPSGKKQLSESSQNMSYVFDALEEAAQANIDKYSSVLEDDPFDIALG